MSFGMAVDHLVVGAGEVGVALAEVLDCPVRDVEETGHRSGTLHVAFPFSGSFVSQVDRLRSLHSADLVVVHSTVPPGTCDRAGWVHSPVRGKHPDLVGGLRTFVKHFGGDGADVAAARWDAVSGTPGSVVHGRAVDTEAGKVWELVQYGVNIAVEKEIHRWCAANGVDFDVAYTRFAETYNDGYAALGNGEFVRPVLKHVPGPIGGHCVRENSWMVDSWLSDVVIGTE